MLVEGYLLLGGGVYSSVEELGQIVEKVCRTQIATIIEATTPPASPTCRAPV